MGPHLLLPPGPRSSLRVDTRIASRRRIFPESAEEPSRAIDYPGSFEHGVCNGGRTIPRLHSTTAGKSAATEPVLWAAAWLLDDLL